MFENIEKLNTLRSTKRSTLAKAIKEIIDFCDDNGFQNLYKTKSICYSNAYSGQYEKVLIIREFDDDYVGIELNSQSSDISYERKVKDIENEIVCNSEKRKRRGGHDYNTGSWLTPKMKECKEWVEKIRQEIESAIQKEIEWLENWK